MVIDDTAQIRCDVIGWPEKIDLINQEMEHLIAEGGETARAVWKGGKE